MKKMFSICLPILLLISCSSPNSINSSADEISGIWEMKTEGKDYDDVLAIKQTLSSLKVSFSGQNNKADFKSGNVLSKFLSSSNADLLTGTIQNNSNISFSKFDLIGKSSQEFKLNKTSPDKIQGTYRSNYITLNKDETNNVTLTRIKSSFNVVDDK